jgi:hypothetical protein
MIGDPIEGFLFVFAEHLREGALRRLPEIAIALGWFVLPYSVLVGNEDQRVLWKVRKL